jgi:hypothetical protein
MRKGASFFNRSGCRDQVTMKIGPFEDRVVFTPEWYSGHKSRIAQMHNEDDPQGHVLILHYSLVQENFQENSEEAGHTQSFRL